MGLVVVSGLSGAGKSVAMDALEDLGYYCVDNLPVSLLEVFVDELDGMVKRTAVSLDARNLDGALADLPGHIAELRSRGLLRRVVFLEAVDEALLKRFSETRRRHPLTPERRHRPSVATTSTPAESARVSRPWSRPSVRRASAIRGCAPTEVYIDAGSWQFEPTTSFRSGVQRVLRPLP